VTDAAGQAWWFQFEVERVAIGVDEAIGFGLLSWRNARLFS
jgi:hypothetical protein